MKSMRFLFAALICVVGFTSGPPHHAYGPKYVGYGDTIRVDLDTACNVMAMDNYNYQRYQRGENFDYFGGYVKKSPFFLKPPSGSYYVIIDNGGDGYQLRASVRVMRSR